MIIILLWPFTTSLVINDYISMICSFIFFHQPLITKVKSSVVSSSKPKSPLKSTVNFTFILKLFKLCLPASLTFMLPNIHKRTVRIRIHFKVCSIRVVLFCWPAIWRIVNWGLQSLPWGPEERQHVQWGSRQQHKQARDLWEQLRPPAMWRPSPPWMGKLTGYAVDNSPAADWLQFFKWT